jgi:hypothetical protein
VWFPAVFLIDYRDGLEAAAFMMTGAVSDFTVALDIEGAPAPFAADVARERQVVRTFRVPGTEHRRDVRDGYATLPVERRC